MVTSWKLSVLAKYCLYSSILAPHPAPFQLYRILAKLAFLEKLRVFDITPLP